jgi:hypothetical protein
MWTIGLRWFAPTDIIKSFDYGSGNFSHLISALAYLISALPHSNCALAYLICALPHSNYALAHLICALAHSNFVLPHSNYALAYLISALAHFRFDFVYQSPTMSHFRRPAPHGTPVDWPEPGSGVQYETSLAQRLRKQKRYRIDPSRADGHHNPSEHKEIIFNATWC